MSLIPWFKVDDHLATHPKVATAGLAAMGLWVKAGSWSAQHLTDGVIPISVLSLLGAKRSHAEQLVKAGLWDAEPGGYSFRDWFDYQPTAEKSAEIKEKRREAGRKGGIASGQSRAEGNQK